MKNSQTEIVYTQKQKTVEMQHSGKYLLKRKFFLVLPLLTIPFLTMAFWALGGGIGTAQSNHSLKNSGLNLELPDANLKAEKEQDKLSFYNKAQEDSIRLRQEMLNDPFYKNGLDTMLIPLKNFQPSYGSKLNSSPYHSSGTTDPTEAKIYERIDALNKAIQQPSETDHNGTENISSNQNTSGSFSGDIDRLEHMMQVMNNKGVDDPEINQLGTMLDKILDIQHPERIKEKIREKSSKNKEMVFPVSKQVVTGSISLLDTAKIRVFEETGFFGIEQDDTPSQQNAIEAVVHENQTLVTGAVVKLRLLNAIYIAGTLIPKESFVFGVALLNGERLQIETNSIRTGSSLFPVKLEVYDMDGLPGIYIPGAITRDVAKQSADNSLQLMQLGTVDPSLKAQAAAAGINATKNLLSKKVKLVKVMVKAGYKVLLKDKQFEQ
jgi:conjugative transposon TraM protein